MCYKQPIEMVPLSWAPFSLFRRRIVRILAASLILTTLPVVSSTRCFIPEDDSLILLALAESNRESSGAEESSRDPLFEQSVIDQATGSLTSAVSPPPSSGITTDGTDLDRRRSGFRRPVDRPPRLAQ